MTRWHRFIPAVAVALLLGACGGNGSDTPLSPAGPKFDGGYIVVGNATPPPDSTKSSSSTTSSSSTAEVPPDTTSRGGYIVVGN